MNRWWKAYGLSARLHPLLQFRPLLQRLKNHALLRHLLPKCQVHYSALSALLLRSEKEKQGTLHFHHKFLTPLFTDTIGLMMKSSWISSRRLSRNSECSTFSVFSFLFNSCCSARGDHLKLADILSPVSKNKTARAYVALARSSQDQ